MSNKKRPLMISRADAEQIKERYNGGEWANTICLDYPHVSRWKIYGIARGDYDDALAAESEIFLTTRDIARLLAWPTPAQLDDMAT